MDTETRKRLEEAAEKYALEHKAEWLHQNFYVSDSEEGFIAGAEYGYKEATAQAKEWLREHVPSIITETEDYVKSFELHMIPMSKFLADFEADMNKLWEGEK